MTGWLIFEHRPTWIEMFAAVDRTSVADQSSGSIPLVDHSSFSLLFSACRVQVNDIFKAVPPNNFGPTSQLGMIVIDRHT